MNVRDRRIRRLHLACEREEHARRGQTMLADGLRTASLDDEGRIIVIRSLALGRISPLASATEWSLCVERRVRAARANAVFAADAAAKGAAAVWFPNQIELWVMLAARAAGGAPCREWFWPLAAPGWNANLSTSETLRLAFQKLAAEGGLMATFLLARRLARNGTLLLLLRVVSPGDFGLVLPTEDSLAATEPVADNAPRGRPLLSAVWESLVLAFLAEAQPDDARVTWLVAAALYSDAAVLPPDVELRRRARTVLQSLIHLHRQHGESGSLAQDGVEANRFPTKEESSTIESPTPLPTSDPQGELTGYGGLFFLIPLFIKLGVARLSRPGGAAWQALRLVFERCCHGREDNLHRLLPDGGECPDTFFLPPLFQADARRFWLARHRCRGCVLLDATGRLPIASWRRGDDSPARDLIRKHRIRRATTFPSELEPAAVALALGAHRLCRKQVGLGLKTVVRRPARLVLTPTHIDVFFRPGEMDVRIRRAALDIDPGWVPWLGRIVSFHYSRSD
jgi:hypothetical protein